MNYYSPTNKNTELKIPAQGIVYSDLFTAIVLYSLKVKNPKAVNGTEMFFCEFHY